MDIWLLLVPLVVLLIPLGFYYSLPYLSSWNALARDWRSNRRKEKIGRAAIVAEVDWNWNYGWGAVRVSLVETGIYCHPRWFAASWFVYRGMPFHAPLIVPWSAIYEVRNETSRWWGDMIEIRARTRDTHFRLSYPADLGFPEDKKPRQAR